MTDRTRAYIGLALGIFIVAVIGAAKTSRCATEPFWKGVQIVMGTQCR